MKILLVRAPFEFPAFLGRPDISFNVPVGLLSIASVLEQNGYSPEVFDSLVYGEREYHDGNTLRFGASYEQIQQEIERRHPDVVGIGSHYTTQLYPTLKVAESVKRVDPNIVVVVGGAHASARPQDFFELTSSVDFACLGEGEYMMLGLIQYLEGKKPIDEIENIAYLDKDGKLAIKPYDKIHGSVQDLDELPFPAYHLVDMGKYFDFAQKGYMGRTHYKSNRVVTMLTSRGCPFHCCFCALHLHMSRHFRGNSPEYVIRHIDYLVKQYNVKHISFEDDTINANPRRFDRILDGLIQANLGITWDTPNGVRADLLSREMLIKAKKSGCTFLTIGVESGDQEILDRVVHKRLNLADVVQVSKWCHELGIGLTAFFMIGFPGEKKENIERTLEFALMLNRKYDVIPGFSIARPYYGTDMYETAKSKGYLLKEPTPENLALIERYEQYGENNLIKTPDFTPEELKRYRKAFYRKLLLLQMLKPKYYFKSFLTSPTIYLRLARRIRENV